MPPVIVIGCVGGFIKHDNLVHSEVQLAARLREAYPIGVDVETFESYHGKRARKKILSLLDTNHDGTLTPDEKQNGRIIIYGHSWGGSDAIALARELEKDGIPVRLTVQGETKRISPRPVRDSRGRSRTNENNREFVIRLQICRRRVPFFGQPWDFSNCEQY